MANVMKELKAEISRIARAEIRAALQPIKSVNAAQRKYIADLRRQVAQLEKENKQLCKEVFKSVPAPKPVPPDVDLRGWFTSQGIRSMRKRLRLSQKDFADLAGVSLPTVTNWEGKKKGKLNIRRPDIFIRLQEIKEMGLRDVQKFFDEQQSQG